MLGLRHLEELYSVRSNCVYCPIATKKRLHQVDFSLLLFPILDKASLVFTSQPAFSFT